MNNLDHRIEHILHEISPNHAVLDIGCEHHNIEIVDTEAWLHKYLYGKVKYILGIDILESEIEKLKNFNYNVIVADAENFELNQKFDITIAGELIEHLSNPGKLLERCKDHLKDKGKLILTTPNAWCVLNQISVIFKGFPLLNIEHTCWYDRQTIFQLLILHSFRIEKFEFIKNTKGARGWLISYILYIIGLKQLGGSGLFLECSLKRKTP